MTQEIRTETATGNEHDIWSELLQQSRLALAMLDAETLENLAKRADDLLALAAADGPANTFVDKAELGKNSKLSREHDLLRDLIVESGSNLRVLRKSRGVRRDNQDGDVWVR